MARMDRISTRDARDLLQNAERPVVFTGAGVSAESGVPTFRDGGFWDEFPPNDFAHWEGIIRLATTDPERLAVFIEAVVRPIAEARPNAAHHAIAAFRPDMPVLTQNIDGLHQEAGSRVVHEVHGSLLRLADLRGRAKGAVTRSELLAVADRMNLRPRNAVTLWKAARPLLQRQGLNVVRPDLVLFGDAMAEPDWEDAKRAAASADAMLTVGTSGAVFPAASLPHQLLERGLPVVVVDPGPPDSGLWVEGTAGEVVPMLLS